MHLAAIQVGQCVAVATTLDYLYHAETGYVINIVKTFNKVYNLRSIDLVAEKYFKTAVISPWCEIANNVIIEFLQIKTFINAGIKFYIKGNLNFFKLWVSRMNMNERR